MADYVNITDADDNHVPVLADEGATGYVQGVKLIQSADGSETPISADGDGLAVNVTNASFAVTNDGLTDLAAAVVGDHVQSDVLTVPAPLTTTGGGTEAAALRVTMASDSTGVLSVDDNGGALTVDGAVTATLWASGDAGDEALTSSDGHLWVGVANTVNVADGGGALTVDGAVTANLSATDNAVLDSIQTAVEVLDNCISGSEAQVDVVSSALPSGAATAAKQPALGTAGTPSADVISVQGVASGTVLPVSDGGSTLSIDDGGGALTVDGAVTATLWASGDAGDEALTSSDGHLWVGVANTVNVAGTGATNLGKAEDAAHGSGDTGVMALGVANTNAGTAGSNASGDYTFIATDLNGVVFTQPAQQFRRTRVTKNVDYTASQTGATVWDPTGGTSFVITHITVSASGAGTLTIFDNTDAAGNIIFEGTLVVGGGLDADYASMHWKSAAADNILKYTTGAGATGSIAVTGYEI